LTSITGVGKMTSICLIIRTQSFEKFDNWRQAACYCGCAPFEYSSGTSINGRTRVSPLADLKLKSLLTMCALSAIRYDAELKAYYERKIVEGKNKMLIINNIRCKLLARIFAVINRNSPYVNTHRFAS
jgi:transposase